MVNVKFCESKIPASGGKTSQGVRLAGRIWSRRWIPGTESLCACVRHALEPVTGKGPMALERREFAALCFYAIYNRIMKMSFNFKL